MTLHALSQAIKSNHREPGVPLIKRPRNYKLFDDITSKVPEVQAG